MTDRPKYGGVPPGDPAASAPEEELRAQLCRHRRPCIAAIGKFDGVHAGHRRVLATARSTARERGLAVVAVTFSPRPEQVLRPNDSPADICSLDERVSRLLEAGADDVAVVRFTLALAAVPAERFVAHLVDDLGMQAMCVGGDFALGRGRSGDVEAIRAMGVEVIVPDLVCGPDGAKISSSALRGRVREL